jgi:ribose transport system permease protein
MFRKAFETLFREIDTGGAGVQYGGTHREPAVPSDGEPAMARATKPGAEPPTPGADAAGRPPAPADPPTDPAAGALARLGWLRRRGATSATAILTATAALFVVSWLLQPQSLSNSSVLGMLPFASVLAIVAVGQTLVIQQGGIDLSVPGFISLTVIIVTHYPDGDSSRLLPSVLGAYLVAVLAGAATGVLVSRVGVTAIVATLGMNALLYGGVLGVSGGTPRSTTAALHDFATARPAGVPMTVVLAVLVTAAVGFVVKRTVAGRRFEAVGSGGRVAHAVGLPVRRHQLLAYVAAAALYCTAGVLLAGVISAPSAFQGDTYLLPSVAAVVLGGTSLLGGKGSVVASAVAALFLSQLSQVLLTAGVSSAVRNLVEAGALAVGVGIYSVHWPHLARAVNLPGRPRPQPSAGAI